jgi:hypothetical protein
MVVGKLYAKGQVVIKEFAAAINEITEADCAFLLFLDRDFYHC